MVKVVTSSTNPSGKGDFPRGPRPLFQLPKCITAAILNCVITASDGENTGILTASFYLLKAWNRFCGLSLPVASPTSTTSPFRGLSPSADTQSIKPPSPTEERRLIKPRWRTYEMQTAFAITVRPDNSRFPPPWTTMLTPAFIDQSAACHNLPSRAHAN